MPYIQRREGKITGLYANVQEGYAEEYLPDDDSELLAFTNDARALTISKIEEIESHHYMTRGEREAWIALVISTAASQGVTEGQLYIANPFYKKLKDANTEIAALRAQL